MGTANIVTYPDGATVAGGWWLVAGSIAAAAAVDLAARYQLPAAFLRNIKPTPMAGSSS